MKRFYIIALFSMFCVTLFSQNPTDKKWWKETVFYQIYMPSFQDSNGDGYSDFRGMTSRLDYLKSLGVKGIWLTPFLKSPKVDNGYDIADYFQVDPTYGNIDDFKEFISQAHSKGIKVIMDMVVNHTSTDCEWFQEAKKSKDNPYRDYYIWKDKPNNWDSFFGGSAWQLDTLTNQYYLHKFAVRMADLNWANPKVVNEIKNVLRFWLNLGIDGFRFDVINFLNTNDITTDNPIVDGNKKAVYNINQPDIKNAIKTIKSVVNEYPDKFTVGEVGNDQIDVLKEFQSPEMMDVVFNFNFGSIPHFSIQRLYNELVSMEKNMPDYPTLFFGSHDNPRLRTRLADGNLDRALALAALTLTAKGVPFIYYGEEIGMEDITADNYSEIADIQGKTFYQLAIDAGKTREEALTEGNNHNRDKSRSPMQWDDSKFVGFSTVKPWIKSHEDAKNINVRTETNAKNSMLSNYKKLLALRNSEPALQYGEYKNLTLKDNRISFTRTYQKESVSVVINFGKRIKINLPKNAQILMGSVTLRKNNFIIYKTKL